MSNLRNIKWLLGALKSFIFSHNTVKEIRNLKDSKKGRSIILAGNAPSLRNFDISIINKTDIDLATVNCGYRIFKDFKSSYHFVSDKDCYEKYKNEILSANTERIVLRENFFKNKKTNDKKIILIPYRKGGVIKRGYYKDISLGIGNDSSVLIFATQVLAYLGYSQIYIIGCDLSYNEVYKYAYEMTEKDLEHEKNEITIAKRKDMIRTNLEFKILRTRLEEIKIKIYNAGIGGNLNSLKRIKLEDALKVEKRV